MKNKEDNSWPITWIQYEFNLNITQNQFKFYLNLNFKFTKYSQLIDRNHSSQTISKQHPNRTRNKEDMINLLTVFSLDNIVTKVTELRVCNSILINLCSKYANVYNSKVVTYKISFPELQKSSKSDKKLERYA